LAEGEYQQEAYLVLIQLQYSDAEARELVARAVGKRPDIVTSDALIQEYSGVWRKEISGFSMGNRKAATVGGRLHPQMGVDKKAQ
jgi:hypothetical protein